MPVGDRLFLVVSEPARFADEVLGTLTVGYALDDAVATRLAEETGCDVNIAAGRVLYASSLPEADRAALASLVASDHLPQNAVVTRVGAGDYVVGTFPLSATESTHPAVWFSFRTGVRLRSSSTKSAADYWSRAAAFWPSRSPAASCSAGA